MSDPDAAKLRTCFHESSHAVVATLLGGWVEVVSTKAGEHYAGITLLESFAVNTAAELLARRHGTSLLARWGAVPYALFDPEQRSRAERSIMVSLAGHLGELLMPEFVSGGYRDDTTDIDQARAIATAADLTVAQAGWLHESEHQEIPVDEDAAFETAKQIGGDDGAAALVNHLAWETRRLVFGPLVRTLVPPVADELRHRETIPGSLVREIVESVSGETLTHDKEATMVQVAAKQVDPNTPRIAGDTPLSQLVVCIRAILRSEAGPCAEGVITTVDDPRVLLAPDCFAPVADRIDGLFFPLDELLDG
jgi:hypothetical protein